ncbi:hypothetical protein Tsubulata_008699 [Turnera subulata]|uniref:Phospholipid scramblase n=1 Tax=Turnera subulata TaxID=218843 RepID=A0A9Q0F6S3_9ROSI|nr:hypothetical protein Tsubulata_008699 [Turnera subulata]
MMELGKRWQLLAKATSQCCAGNYHHHHYRRLIPRRRYADNVAPPPNNHPSTTTTATANQLSRDFLAQLWILEAKMAKNPKKTQRRRKSSTSINNNYYYYGNVVAGVGVDDDDNKKKQPSFHNLISKWFSNVVTQPPPSPSSSSSAAPPPPPLKEPPLPTQPPPSQPVSGFLQPRSLQEITVDNVTARLYFRQFQAKVAPLLARSNLLITRDIEWANLVLGFEQETRYAVVDVCYPHSPVGVIREQSNVIARQLLRIRRPFVAYVTDSMGNELFRVRRPFWWITSSIYAEIDGKEIGVVHQRWHLWRRIYDLYLGNKQFAVVENPGFWNWTFTLRDINGEVLAQIDRDWRGFGFEIFTDAGQYVIRFGSSDPSLSRIPELEVVRPLTLSERAVAVALAISLDNDYFSRHGGWALPFIAVSE